MDSYYEVKSKLSEVNENIEDLINQCDRSISWTEDCLINVKQQEKIIDSLESLKKKLEKQQSEVMDTSSRLRG